MYLAAAALSQRSAPLAGLNCVVVAADRGATDPGFNAGVLLARAIMTEGGIVRRIRHLGGIVSGLDGLQVGPSTKKGVGVGLPSPAGSTLTAVFLQFNRTERRVARFRPRLHMTP